MKVDVKNNEKTDFIFYNYETVKMEKKELGFQKELVKIKRKVELENITKNGFRKKESFV